MVFCVRLPDRGLIRLEGENRHGFLQGLVSNDIDLLKAPPAVPVLYACLLTPQGKFLHDFFISESGDALLLECEGGARKDDLLRRLAAYRLRAKISLSGSDDVPVHAVFGAQPPPGYPDPRHPDMGWRTLEKPQGIEEKPFAAWDERRLALGIPDGSRDMVPGGSTLLECRIDEFAGISFTKGCYVGQELTARMHHRGLAKKHLVPVRIEDPARAPAPGTEIVIGGRIAGEMRSSCGHTGLALLKDEAVAAGPVVL